MDSWNAKEKGKGNEMALDCWDWWDGLMGGTREMNPESELLESDAYSSHALVLRRCFQNLTS